jgi:outer membrane usher protein
VPIFKTANLSADIIETTGTGKTEWTSSLMFTSYLGKWGTANINFHNNGVNSVSANLQKTPENDQGLGYRLTGQYQDRVGGTTGSEVSWAGTHGVYALQYQSQQNTDIYGMKMSGSIATLFDDIYFSRPVYDSFAVIKIDSLKDVPVYNGGREVGRTNEDGKVFAPSVSSYGINPFIVKQHDLPFNYSAPTLTKSISPGWRSGTHLDFEVDKIQAVRGNISIVERGIKKAADFWVLSIIINGRAEVAPLVKDGEFYMEGIPVGTWHAEIAKEKNICKFEINIPKSEEAMIDLGLLTCITK